MENTLLYESEIKKVTFTVGSDLDTVNSSTVSITSHDLFRNNAPQMNGVFDKHLGTIDNHVKCDTCKNKKKDCMGHDGHIKLNYPVFHPLVVGEIKKWLKLICFNCGYPVLKENEYKNIKKEIRLDEASKISKNGTKVCPVCKTIHPTVQKDEKSPLIILKKENKGQDDSDTKELYPHEIKMILDKITDETVLKLGKNPLSHPRNFIWEYLRVPPTVIRPDVVKSGGGRSTNDYLTTLLVEIVRKNEMLPEVIPEEFSAQYKDSIHLLNVKVYELIKGTLTVKTLGSNTLMTQKSLSQRLKGKFGSFRKNQLGKRTHNCARSTITGDPNLRINELGVPINFAKILQIAEVVQEYNITRLLNYYQNGTKRYPGCTKIVKKSTSAEYSVDNPRGDIDLEIGDTLYRDLITNDVVNFNRQPSLKPSNIAGHVITITHNPEIKTLRMNVIVCALYNADFDGDEMNMYVSSNITAINEIEELNGVSNFLVSYAKSSPDLGEADDSIIGTFELTRSGVEIDKYHAMLIYSTSGYLPNFKKQNYTGRDMISMMLEDTPINYSGTPLYYNPDYAYLIKYDPTETKISIKNGVLEEGVLDKRSIGKTQGSIFHIIANEYGPNISLEKLFNIQQISIGYMLQFGYTIGLKDMLVSKNTLDEIHKIESKLIGKSKEITWKLNKGSIIPPIGKTTQEYYEDMQISELKVQDDFVRPIFESINPKTNNFFKLVMTGSKGKKENLLHVSSAIGQIIINGQRARENFGHARSSPYFTRFDTSPESRGYITNSYIGGTNVTEFIFSAMNARFDLISKALSTSITGDQNRKSIKNLESIITNNLRMCLKGDTIIQFIYGENGLDTRKVVRAKFTTIKISDEDFNKLRYESNNSGLQKIFDKEFNQLKEDREKYRDIFLKFENINVKELMTDSRLMPFDALNIYKDLKSKLSLAKTKQPSDSDLADMIIMVKEYCDRFPYLLLNELMEKNKAPIPLHIEKATWLAKVLIRSTLHTQNLKTINKEILEAILNKISLRYLWALQDAGTPVGIIAAQSFSEPLTQYMLDAHHRSATGGTSKSSMDKVKEVLGARHTKDINNPIMLLTMEKAYEYDKDKTQQIANLIEMMKLQQFVTLFQIFYEKYNNPIHPNYKHEKKMIEEFNKYNPLLRVPSDLTNWCIRLVLNRTMLILKNMVLEVIINKLRDVYPDLYIIYTPENVKNIIIRIYIRNVMFKNIDIHVVEDLVKNLLSLVIRGVEGIRLTKVVKMIRHKILPNGSIEQDNSRWGIQTIGTNISGIMQIKGIDIYKIQTDAIEETTRMYGIESARHRIVSEIRNLGDGGDINHQHLLLYADEMSHTGKVSSIEKGGLNAREGSNVLLRVGFSSPIQILEKAAVNHAEDKVTGVTAPLLMGNIPKIGTIYNSFSINPQVIKENIVTLNSLLDDI